jgi:hypothetical protein
MLNVFCVGRVVRNRNLPNTTFPLRVKLLPFMQCTAELQTRQPVSLLGVFEPDILLQSIARTINQGCSSHPSPCKGRSSLRETHKEGIHTCVGRMWPWDLHELQHSIPRRTPRPKCLPPHENISTNA